jgi:SF3a60/Prp9 C-terminal
VCNPLCTTPHRQLVWNKLKKDETKKEWNPEEMMEEEDDEGNVYNHKLFQDLKRQGIITPAASSASSASSAPSYTSSASTSSSAKDLENKYLCV